MALGDNVMVDEKTEGQTKEILKTGPPFLMSRKGDRDERQNRECVIAGRQNTKTQEHKNTKNGIRFGRNEKGDGRDEKGGYEMGNYYLKTVTVPIPFEDKLVVIRKGVRVEYEIDRIYLPEEQNTRVKRKVIGKVDPVQPGRMFPNEFYFELFPENEVPEEVREEFLRACATVLKMTE